MRIYPIPELANALGAFVKGLTRRTIPRPIVTYEPFWPQYRGSGGMATSHTVTDIEEAEDWEDLLVLTPQDRREHRKWLNSLGKCSS